MTLEEAMILNITENIRPEYADMSIKTLALLRKRCVPEIAKKRAAQIIKAMCERMGDDAPPELIELNHKCEDEQKTETLQIRVSPMQKQYIKQVADRYTGGNVSRLIWQAVTTWGPKE